MIYCVKKTEDRKQQAFHIHSFIVKWLGILLSTKHERRAIDIVSKIEEHAENKTTQHILGCLANLYFFLSAK